MEYNKLLSTLKRFSFEEKMRMLQIHSRQTFTAIGVVDAGTMRTIPSPWELETFLLFSIKAEEWKYDILSEKKFARIINCIRNKNSPLLENYENQDFLTWFFAVTGSVQFEIQEIFQYKLFRFAYFFSFKNERIDMPLLFREKFGCEYYNYALLCLLLWFGFSSKDFKQELYEAIIKHFSFEVSHLELSRKAYADMLDQIATDPIHYLYCLRPSYAYPFINFQSISYCPLPHLLRRATTSSMMYRLTDKNAALKDLIGKEVYESYLLKLISESNIFNEVIPEQTYYRKTEYRTADVMARSNSSYVFFDSKSFSPKTSIRTFSQDALDKDILRLAQSCAQMYKHIRLRFPHEYNFFKDFSDNPIENIFGLVVIQESAYILGDKIYRKAAEILGISEDSDDYIWLYSHVGIISIYDLERFCFTGTDICSVLQETCKKSKIEREWLTGNCNPKIIYPPLLSFIRKITDDTVAIAKELGSNLSQNNIL